MSMHVVLFFFFQNSTLAAKRMSSKTGPYTFSLKNGHLNVTKKSQTKINNLYLTNCNGSVTVLLHNARTRALFGFWYLRKKVTCLLAKKQKRQL